MRTRKNAPHARGMAPARSSRGLRFALRMHHQLAERLGSEEPRDVGDFHRRLETLSGDLRQIRSKLRHSLFGDDAFLLELRFRQVSARILHDLAARNLDLERALESKDHAQEIDRFRIEAFDQRHVDLDILDVAAERVGHRLGDLGIDRHDFFLCGFRLRHAFRSTRYSTRYSTHYSILKPPSTPMT